MDKKNFHAKAVRFGLTGTAPAARNGALKGGPRRRTMPPPAAEGGDDE
jgi:hypothetical protein